MASKHASRLVTLLTLSILITSSNGCTLLVWSWAEPHRDSLSGDDGEPRIARTPGGQALVFSYNLPNNQPAGALIVPLDAEGRPSAPFAYTGHAHSADEFWTSVPDAQKKKILGTRRTKIGAKLQPATLPSINVDPSELVAHSAWPEESFDSYDELIAIAYRIDKTGPVLVPIFTKDAQGSPDQLTPDATIVIIPQFVGEDDPTHGWRVATAVVVTPVTMPLDIVFYPFWVLVYAAAQGVMHVGESLHSSMPEKAPKARVPATDPAVAKDQ
jgi:hypothetical protein